MGGGERIPTLESVIRLCQNSPNMLLNIELKGPRNGPMTAKYNYKLAAKKVVNLINKHKIASKVMISSFVPRILRSIIEISPPSRKFIINNLVSNTADVHDGHDLATYSNFDGSNIDYRFLTEEIVTRIHSELRRLGVWYSKFTSVEN